MKRILFALTCAAIVFGCVAHASAQATQPADLAASLSQLQKTLGTLDQQILLAQAQARAAQDAIPQPAPTFTITHTPKYPGEALHVNGLALVPAGVKPEACTFAWDFGDAAGSSFDALPGMNAAHVYDAAGDYLVKLAINAPGGSIVRAQHQITVPPETRPLVDLAPGTLWPAFKSDTRYLVHAGTYTLGVTATPATDDAFIAQGGAGTVTLNWTGAPSGVFFRGNDGLVLQGITFDSPLAPNDGKEGIAATPLQATGNNLVVRDCVFNNVGYAINANGNPSGLLVQNCTAPIAGGLRGYFLWYQGADIVAIGNMVAGSAQEHCIRGGNGSGTVERVNLSFNALNNSLDKKGCIVGQTNVHFATMYGNIATGGPIGVGPLGGPDALKDGVAASADTAHVRVEKNTINGGYFKIEPGASGIVLANNRFTGCGAIIQPADASYPTRTVSDITIDHNTFVLSAPATFVAPQPATIGRALWVIEPVKSLVFTNNLLVAANYVTGGYQSAAVLINFANPDTSTWTIAGNVYPTGPRCKNICAVGSGDGTGYAIDAWNALVKGTDQQQAVMLDASGNPTDPAVTAGAH